jgi:hypothetical protein
MPDLYKGFQKPPKILSMKMATSVFAKTFYVASSQKPNIFFNFSVAVFSSGYLDYSKNNSEFL